ncbi:MAG TPA: T9SS type A sorting domain-containing protein [Chitinophagales bacterium]|nr:T9SS type A sorting domain-containing protein [Chitinophagales bacterium]
MKKLHYPLLIIIAAMMMTNASQGQTIYCKYGVIGTTGDCPSTIVVGGNICVTCDNVCGAKTNLIIKNTTCNIRVKRLDGNCAECGTADDVYYDWADFDSDNSPKTWTTSSGNKFVLQNSSNHDTTLHFTVVNVSDTPKIIILQLNSTYVWNVNPPIPNALNFNPYEYRDFDITVTVPGGTAAGTSNVFTLFAATNGVANSQSQASASITVVQSFLSASVSSTDVTCHGNGSASINASGGISPYSYAWSNGATTQNINGLSAGAYTCTVTDNAGAMVAVPVDIGGYELPLLSINPTGTVSICSGSSITLVANYDPNVTYQWRKGNKNVNGATNQTYTVKQASNYSVRETDSNGCSATSAPTTIVVNQAPTATITAPDGLDLCGHSSLPLQASNGTTYMWQKGQNIIQGATNQTYYATSKGSYKVTVTNQYGCSKTSAGAKVVKTCREDEPGTELSNTELMIYPNPSNGKFTLDIVLNNADNTEVTINVTDLLGQLVYEQIIPAGDGELHKEIQLDAVQAGIYFVKVRLNDDVYSRKLVITRQ